MAIALQENWSLLSEKVGSNGSKLRPSDPTSCVVGRFDGLIMSFLRQTSTSNFHLDKFVHELYCELKHLGTFPLTLLAHQFSQTTFLSRRGRRSETMLSRLTQAFAHMTSIFSESSVCLISINIGSSLKGSSRGYRARNAIREKIDG